VHASFDGVCIHCLAHFHYKELPLALTGPGAYLPKEEEPQIYRHSLTMGGTRLKSLTTSQGASYVSACVLREDWHGTADQQSISGFALSCSIHPNYVTAFGLSAYSLLSCAVFMGTWCGHGPAHYDLMWGHLEPRLVQNGKLPRAASEGQVKVVKVKAQILLTKP